MIIRLDIWSIVKKMKYGEKFTAEKEVVGIPAEEFENVIMTYLPVTKEELKEWAVNTFWDCLYRK